jgi:hypothetical protein
MDTTTSADQLDNGAKAMSGQPFQHERLEAIIAKAETDYDKVALRAICIVANGKGERTWQHYELRAGVRIRAFVPLLHAEWNKINGR